MTFKEHGLRIVHQSRLALLVLPLISNNQTEPIPVEYARDFADAFNLVILREGTPAFSFIKSLKKEDKEKIAGILKLGGMVGTVYLSGDDRFSV